MWRRLTAISLPRTGLVINPLQIPSIPASALRFINSTQVQQENSNKLDDEALLELEKQQRLQSPRRMLMLKLKHFLSCSEVKALDLVDKNKALLKVPLNNISQNLEYLYEKNVTASTIKENLWLLGRTTGL